MANNIVEGVRFAFKRSNSIVAYCAMSVNTGTRNEGGKHQGIAHFTEHMIFKGTETRSANTINSYIEKLGGELNAYTTKEETVIHATVLKDDIAKAIDLLIELSFRAIFPQKEIEKEQGVVTEEIISYKDSPSDQIFDDFEEYIFAGSPLSSPVLGKTSSLKKIKREDLLDYYHRMFVPQNMTFTVVADLDEEKVLKILRKSLLKYAPALSENIISGNEKFPATSFPPFSKVLLRRNHQAHCIIGATAYSLFEEKRLPLILLVNILGGPAANSTLNLLLREKKALVYGVEASYTQYLDTGVVFIYFGCDKDKLSKCISLVENVLKDARDIDISEKALKDAKKQLLGQLAIAADNGESQVLSMGKSLNVFGRILEMEETAAKINAITPLQMREVAKEIFAEKHLSRLIYK